MLVMEPSLDNPQLYATICFAQHQTIPNDVVFFARRALWNSATVQKGGLLLSISQSRNHASEFSSVLVSLHQTVHKLI